MSRRLLLAVATTLGGLALAGAAQAATSCERLTRMTMADVQIASAQEVAAGPFTPPGARAKAVTLPAFCRVATVARPTADSEINFEVWIPTAGWNGKFEGVGTGGYMGAVNYGALAEGLKRGYAVASTDMGHTGDDLVFGQGHPEKVADWAWRAIHVTAQAGKLIVRNNQGRWPARSYFVGCATGGHQAMSEVIRFPDDYDGVIAGDPANNRLHETAGYLAAWLAVHDGAGVPLLKRSDLQLVTRAATAQCDALDGVADGVIDDPRKCRLDVGALACKPGQTNDCLTALQIAAIRKVYAGARNPRTGAEIFPGWAVGSEGYGPAASDGWGAFLLEPAKPMRSEVYSAFLFHNPDWDFRTFDFDRDVAYADETIGDVAAPSTDLSAFRRRGGKLILYSGWSDPVLPAQDVLDYHAEIGRKMGPTDDFLRFFMVPGMGHCSGGPGPTTFDMLPALEAWVEQGAAPAVVPASRLLPDGRRRTRVLCAYPKVARWSGQGSSDDAANFSCTTPAQASASPSRAG